MFKKIIVMSSAYALFISYESNSIDLSLSLSLLYCLVLLISRTFYMLINVR